MPNFEVEPIRASLPAFCQEALVATDDVTKVGAAWNEDGWVWLVSGRHLFVWQFGSPHLALQCFQLTLPPSGLTCRAQLISVFSLTSAKKQHQRATSVPPACIAVSPEGSLRCWSNIALPNQYSDLNLDTYLSSQECYSCHIVSEELFLISTTTCGLFILQLNDTRHLQVMNPASFQFTALKSSQSLIAGVGRRLSNILWSQAQLDQKLVKVAIAKTETASEFFSLVLSTRTLQFWCVDTHASHKFLWETELFPLLSDTLLAEMWEIRDVKSLNEYRPSLKLWVDDISTIENRRVLLLVGAMNQSISQQICYSLVLCSYTQAGVQISKTVITSFKQQYEPRFEQSVTSMSFSVPSLELGMVFLRSLGDVFCISPVNFTTKVSRAYNIEKLNLNCEGILTIGSFNGQCLMFGCRSGLIYAKRSLPPLAFLGRDTSEKNDTLDDMKQDGLPYTEDKVELFKTAFLMFLRSDISGAEKLLTAMFSPHGKTAGQSLDYLVTDLSTKILDDYPRADPRWAKALPSEVSVSSSSSLIVLYQIEDKKKTHGLFISFLQKLGLFSELTVGTSDDGVKKPTAFILREHGEKLQACIALQSVPSNCSEILNDAITRVMQQREDSLNPDLSVADVFFRKVSGIHQLIPALLKSETFDLESTISAKDRTSVVLATNCVILTMLKEILNRRSKSDSFKLGPSLATVFADGVVPWTASQELKPCLLNQHRLTAETIPDSPDLVFRRNLSSQLYDIISILLTDSLDYLKSAPRQLSTESQKALAKERSSLIEPLVEQNQLEMAAKLAEHFCDFETLIKIAELSENKMQVLQKYVRQFADEGFCDFVYQWYTLNGKPGQLLSFDFGNVKRLIQTNDDLSWICDLRSGSFRDASHTLLKLATAENELVDRKKTMLSISKLAALASEETDEERRPFIDAVNVKLDLIYSQEKLNPEVLEATGFNVTSMRPLSPMEVVELYARDSNSDENSLLKALQIVSDNSVVGDETFIQMRDRIWSSAILQHDWSNIASCTLDDFQHATFVRLLKLIRSEGSLANLVPDIDELLYQQDLAVVKEDLRACYFVKAAFEQCERQLIYNMEEDISHA